MKLPAALGLCLTLWACSEVHSLVAHDEGSPTRTPDGGQRDAEVRDAAVVHPAADSGARDAGVRVQPTGARCGDHDCACDDTRDNDGDGRSDGLDPECTGAFDDDELTFATGQPNKQAQCRDCFWDTNSGNGDDGCRYPVECLSGAAVGGKGNCDSCQPSSGCIDHCQTRTPNGCDCFGCCEVARTDGVSAFVELTDSCNLQRIDELNSCPRCVQNSACVNPCGRCELCLGKTQADLPRDCAGTGPGYVCEDGLSVCGAGSPCAAGLYCLQGCCLVDLL
jgi:hypothetical protein